MIYVSEKCLNCGGSGETFYYGDTPAAQNGLTNCYVCGGKRVIVGASRLVSDEGIAYNKAIEEAARFVYEQSKIAHTRPDGSDKSPALVCLEIAQEIRTLKK